MIQITIEVNEMQAEYFKLRRELLENKCELLVKKMEGMKNGTTGEDGHRFKGFPPIR